jgi:autotransporter-associated beta strand protein
MTSSRAIFLLPSLDFYLNRVSLRQCKSLSRFEQILEILSLKPCLLRMGFIVAATAIFLFLQSPHSHAANINWSGTTGDWSDSVNWGGFEPTSNDMAYIANGGSAFITQFGEGCNTLYLGNGTAGAIQMEGGTLTTNTTFVGYSGVGSFTHSAGINATGTLYVGWSKSGTYTLSGSGELSASIESIGTYLDTGLMQQTGGTNSADYISIGAKGQYKFTGGRLLITGGLDNRGILDFDGGPAVMQAADNTIINLSLSGGLLKNTQAASLTLGANSLLIVPSGFDPTTAFANFSSAGITHTVGTTLAVSSGQTIAGQATIADPVICQGIIAAPSGGFMNLMNGLIIEGSGTVNLGTGCLQVEDSTSGINGGSLSAMYQYIGGTGTGVFTHSAGSNTLSRLYLGDETGSRGTYNLSGSGILSTTDVMKVGHSGTGIFTQSGGTHTVSTALYLGYYAGSSGTYNLNGGTLVLKSLNKGSGTAAFNFGGGALMASGSFTSTLPMTLTGDGGNANIDTAGYTVTLSGKLTGSGSLNKLSLGKLTLSGINTYAGVTSINAGVLSIPATTALPGWNVPGRYTVAAGATLAVGDAVTAANIEAMLATGNFSDASVLGFDVATTRLLNGSTMPSSMGFAKDGAGALTLSSALATTTGSITVLAGTLDMGGFTQGTSGNISILGGTVQNGTLKKNGGIFDAQAGTISAVLADGTNPAGLIKSGSGTLTLAAANTLTGGVTLNAGQININNASALGPSAGTFTVGGASAIDNTSGVSITLLENNCQVWNGDFTFLGSNALNLGAGPITLGGNRQVTVNSKSLTVAGTISGDYSLTKAGNGTLVLSEENSYNGGTFINAGTLNLTSGNNRLCSTGDITIAGGTLDLGGGWQETSASVTLQSGTVQNGTLKKNGGNFDVQAGAISATLVDGTNPAGFIKSGNGLASLTGVNTYSGPTNVNGGTLWISSTAALPG